MSKLQLPAGGDCDMFFKMIKVEKLGAKGWMAWDDKVVVCEHFFPCDQGEGWNPDFYNENEAIEKVKYYKQHLEEYKKDYDNCHS